MEMLENLRAQAYKDKVLIFQSQIRQYNVQLKFENLIKQKYTIKLQSLIRRQNCQNKFIEMV